MTNRCNGILRNCTIVAIASFSVTGCNFDLINDEKSDVSDSASLDTESRTLIVDWSAPVANDDGSPLTDLSGYRFYYGQSPGVYDNKVVVNQAGISSYIIDVGGPGTYYIAMSSVNSAGVESVLSSEVRRLVL